jgi:hypothetical protein
MDVSPLAGASAVAAHRARRWQVAKPVRSLAFAVFHFVQVGAAVLPVNSGNDGKPSTAAPFSWFRESRQGDVDDVRGR